jgi:hypothetical protein
LLGEKEKKEKEKEKYLKQPGSFFSVWDMPYWLCSVGFS